MSVLDYVYLAAVVAVAVGGAGATVWFTREETDRGADASSAVAVGAIAVFLVALAVAMFL